MKNLTKNEEIILLSILRLKEEAYGVKIKDHIKNSIGKLSIEKSLQDFTEHHIIENNTKILNIQLQHVIRIEKIPFHHRDPFDRLIIAQAIEDRSR